MSVSGNSGGFWRSVRQLPGRTPLRVKLITAVLALVTIALAAISIAGISVLKSYLLDQFDGRLSSMQTEAQSSNHGFGGGGFGGQFSPEKFTVEAVTGTGQIYPADRTQPAGQTGPDVPNTAAWLTANNGKPVTVGALSGNGSWRVIAVPDFTFQTISAGGAPGPQINGTLVIGIDVTSVYSTISRLTLIDLIVSVILLAGVAIVGVAVVRASLRPLTDIEQTAGAIAAGDLTRRVPDRDPRTEVGRLGRSLNVMLAQIETAFRARADSEAAARRSEERMRQFVADASHELRTPLTAIRGFAEYYRQRGGLVPHWDKSLTASTGEVDRSDAARAVLGTGLTPDDLDRIMQRVEKEAARMGLLVEDLLLLARLDQQRPLARQPIDLLSLAADAVHDTRMLAPGRTISLSVQPGAAFLVTGDEPRLRQVIGNLMSNALTHTPDETPIEVSISSGILDPRAADPSPAVILDVTDHGPGMTPEQAHRVFERFYRADQARTRTKGGSGLGLAIVSALVAAHGGVASVRTTPDLGATFRVTLPLAPEAQGGLSADDDADEFGQAEELEPGDEASDVSVTYGTAVGSRAREIDQSGAGPEPGDSGSPGDQGNEARQDAAYTGVPRRA